MFRKLNLTWSTHLLILLLLAWIQLKLVSLKWQVGKFYWSLQNQITYKWSNKLVERIWIEIRLCKKLALTQLRLEEVRLIWGGEGGGGTSCIWFPSEDTGRHQRCRRSVDKLARLTVIWISRIGRRQCCLQVWGSIPRVADLVTNSVASSSPNLVAILGYRQGLRIQFNLTSIIWESIIWLSVSN